jgi:hypothetical protein
VELCNAYRCLMVDGISSHVQVSAELDCSWCIGDCDDGISAFCDFESILYLIRVGDIQAKVAGYVGLDDG